MISLHTCKLTRILEQLQDFQAIEILLKLGYACEMR